MKKILLLIFISLNTSFYAQSLFHVTVRETEGSVQYRSILNPSWTPTSAGISISERNFIRLNTPTSFISLSLPDGSILRFMGVGSFYIETVARIQNNARQNKILLLSGRYYYQNALSDTPNRMIINTDITTSVIENGSGGGYFISGTNEFIIRQGRGLISYRQKDSLAIVTEANQFVSFNTYDGFTPPKLANQEKFAEYLIFEKTDAKKDSALKKADVKGKFFEVVDADRLDQIIDSKLKKSFTMNNIELNQLKVLEDISYKTGGQKMRIDLASQQLVQEPPKPPKIIVKQVSLPNDVNLDEFKLEYKKIDTNNKKKRQPKIQAVVPQKRNIDKINVAKKPAQSKTQSKKDSDEDLNKLLRELEERASNERARKPRETNTEPRVKGKVVTEVVEAEDMGVPSYQYEDATYDELEPIYEEPEPIYEEPEPIYEEPEPVYEEKPFSRSGPSAYSPGDSFFNRNLDDEVYQYDRFQFESSDDINNSFSTIFYQI